nr:hypothetical protein [Nostoc sp. ChiSLP03a]MDZ8211211.1 hypothetical protein [Nostoc sp. ChiSLP03a]
MAYYLSWSQTLGIGRDRSYYTPHKGATRFCEVGQKTSDACGGLRLR